MTRNKAIVDASGGGFAEYNEWKRKQEEEEKRIAEQYGMPYEKEDNEEQNSIK